MTPPNEAALADLRWLRRLAARLVRDPERADDAVQEALLRGVEHPPREPGARRGWLAAVLRNALRQDGRAAARRADRERARGASEFERAALDAAAELELHRRLVERVHALEEPYRTAVVLRFLRELTPAEIARELGVPEKTVRTRIERALAKLRERMGPERERWLALLALPGRPAGVSSLPWILPMNLKLAAAAAAVLVAGTAWMLQRPAQPRAQPAPPADPRPALAHAPAATPVEALRPLAAGERESAVALPAPAARREPPTTPPVEVRGSVRTLDGAGVPGVEVVFEPGTRGVYAPAAEAPRATSGTDGAFTLPLPEAEGRLTVRASDLACLAAPQLDGTPPSAPPIVVVAPAFTWAGAVVTPSGAPVPHARVEITLPGHWVQARDVGGTTVHLLLPFAETRADERGRFRFEGAGRVADAVIAARADGAGEGEIALPAESHEALEIVLAPPEERTIHGIVLDAAGAPAADARVSLGGPSAESGPDGRFALAVERWRDAGTLRAVKPGYLAAELALDEALRPSSPERPLELVLGPAPLALRGRVLDADGAPVPHARVWTPDVTPFGSVVMTRGEVSMSGVATVETVLGGGEGPWDPVVEATADAEGTFELTGLLDRDYAVFALDPRTLDAAGPVVLAGGERGARIVLGRSPRAPLAGRVVSRSGAPLAGVRVAPGRNLGWRAEDGANAAAWAGFPLRGAEAACTLLDAGATTDAGGRFDLGALVGEGAYLLLRGPALVQTARFELDAALAPDALEIAVDAAARFRIELARAEEADAFALLDARGKATVLFVEAEGFEISADEAALDGGRSGVVLAPEGRYELSLRALGREVRRVTVDLPAGGPHALHP